MTTALGIFALLAVLGWALGIIGFFRAGRAVAELHDLRRDLARSIAQQSTAPARPAVAPSLPPAAPIAAAQPGASPAAEPPTPRPPPPPPPGRDFEALLTTRWGVWLGAAALLLAGVFLVRYAVDQALLGPAARCGLAALIGVALLAAAEFLQRHDGPVVAGPLRIDQAPAGLAAGGTALLLIASYGAGPFYGLLPPLLAFAAMAAASLIGLAVSLRFGPLTAAIGIAGAFVTPALVATPDPSLPGLFAYLFVVSAAALLVVRRTAWTWLGWATTIAGAVWVCLAATMVSPDHWAAAAFVPAAASLHLLLPPEALDHPVGRRLSWIPLATLGAAGLVLEILVPGTAPRAALFLLSPIAVWKGIAEPRLDRLPWLAALLGLLTLLLWTLPAWQPTGETMTIDGVVQAFLPRDWTPAAIRPFLIGAVVFAAFFAAVGLREERRAANPLRWATLVAAVPVLTLAVAYAKIERFQTNIAWALVALVLSAALTATASRAAGENAPQRAGIHAAGAIAALALGCAMLLRDQWLTLAVALFLPPLAWIEARAELPPLRRVALAVAALILVRLLLNWYVLDYAFGATPLVNGLLAAYAAPAAAFAFAAMLFRRRADDLLVATLEAGAVILLGCFVALEIRHWFGDGRLDGSFEFTQAALHLLALAIQATAYLTVAQRSGRVVLDWAWRILGGAALAYGTLLLIFNPAVTAERAGIFALLAAYLVPAALALVARRRLERFRLRRIRSKLKGRSSLNEMASQSDSISSDTALPAAILHRSLTIYAIVAGFLWITLQIRQYFHADLTILFGPPIEDGELWAWSAAWLVYGIALMVLGIRAGERLLRLMALGVIGLVCLKVFLIDMAGLTGLWRVVSFLGLGLALIGLGVVHRRLVLSAGAPPDPALDGPTEAPTG